MAEAGLAWRTACKTKPAQRLPAIPDVANALGSLLSSKGAGLGSGLEEAEPNKSPSPTKVIKIGAAGGDPMLLWSCTQGLISHDQPTMSPHASTQKQAMTTTGSRMGWCTCGRCWRESRIKHAGPVRLGRRAALGSTIHNTTHGILHIVCCVTHPLFPTLPPYVHAQEDHHQPLASSSSLGVPRPCSFSCLVPTDARRRMLARRVLTQVRKSRAPHQSVEPTINDRGGMFIDQFLHLTTGGRPPQCGRGRGVGAQHHQQQPLGHPQG